VLDADSERAFEEGDGMLRYQLFEGNQEACFESNEALNRCRAIASVSTTFQGCNESFLETDERTVQGFQ